MGLQRLVAISNQLPKFHKKPNEIILLKFPLDNIFEQLLMDLEFQFLHLFFVLYRDWHRYNEKIRFLCYSKVIWGQTGHNWTLEGAREPRTRYEIVLGMMQYYISVWNLLARPISGGSLETLKMSKREPKDRDLGNITGFVRYYSYLWNSIIDQLISVGYQIRSWIKNPSEQEHRNCIQI